MVRAALRPWLEDLISEDSLGLHWLEEKIAHPEQQPIRQEKKAWPPLYRDGESYLDVRLHLNSGTRHSAQIISIAVLSTTQNSASPLGTDFLHQKSPLVLTLSDGNRAIEAVLTPDCGRDLATRYPEVDLGRSLYSIITVRQLTLRFTSYGPSRSKVRLVLQEIDWEQGNAQTHGRPETALSIPSVALRLRKLAEIRALQTEKYAYDDSQIELASGNEGEDTDMSPGNRSQAFASQWSPDDDKLQLGSDNNGREESEGLPAQDTQAAADRAKQAQLLALLNRNRGTRNQSAGRDTPRRTKSRTPQAQHQPADRHSSEPQTAAGAIGANAPSPRPYTNPDRASQTATDTIQMPPPARPATRNSERSARHSIPSAQEASWMQVRVLST